MNHGNDGNWEEDDGYWTKPSKWWRLYAFCTRCHHRTSNGSCFPRALTNMQSFDVIFRTQFKEIWDIEIVSSSHCVETRITTGLADIPSTHVNHHTSMTAHLEHAFQRTPESSCLRRGDPFQPICQSCQRKRLPVRGASHRPKHDCNLRKGLNRTTNGKQTSSYTRQNQSRAVGQGQ